MARVMVMVMAVVMVMAMVTAMLLAATITTTKRMTMNHLMRQTRVLVPSGSHRGPVASKVASQVAAGHTCVDARLTV